MRYMMLLVLLLAGCGDTRNADDPTVLKEQAEALAKEGEVVGRLPDGREILRYRIERGMSHDHYIYITGNTITVNRDVPSGKTSYNHVEVFIDGIPYVPKQEK